MSFFTSSGAFGGGGALSGRGGLGRFTASRAVEAIPADLPAPPPGFEHRRLVSGDRPVVFNNGRVFALLKSA